MEAGRWLWDVRTPLRDGTEVSTDLHLPPAGLAGGPYPAVLVRTAGNNQNAALVRRARVLADAGIAVALQDVRGREDADGAFTPFARREGEDGYDAVEWVAAQDWCNGKVGMMGAGYAGFTQWAAAAEKPPHLTTFVSTAPWAPGQATAGGVLSLAMLTWLHATSARVWQEAGQVDWETVLGHLPLADAGRLTGARLPVWDAWLAAALPAGFWDGALPEVAVPVLQVKGWHDGTPMVGAPDTTVVVGPWDADGAWTPTQQLGGVDFGAEAALDLDALHLQWFQHTLAGEGYRPRSRHFVTGTNTWKDGTPAATDSWSWSLGNETRSFAYDPADPVVVSTDLTFFPSPPKAPPQLALDRRFVERRGDVLVYRSEARDGLEISGTPQARLRISCDRSDTDLHLHLSDVAPGGASQVLATGALRLRHRDGVDTEALLTPGEVYDVVVPLSALAHVLRPGHALTLSVTGSCFPLFDRNLNTGGRIGHESEPLVATTTVHPGSVLVVPTRSSQ